MPHFRYELTPQKGQTGAAASSSMVIDLSWLNKTRILPDYVVDGTSYTVIAMQGGIFNLLRRPSQRY